MAWLDSRWALVLLLGACLAYTPVRLNDIHEAIHHGSYEGVQAALLLGDYACRGKAWCINDTVVDINAVCATDNAPRAGCRTDWDSQSPLMHAVLEGHTDIVRLLLSLGADPSISDKDGYTPMMAAGYIDRSGIGRLLMDHGLDRSALDLRTPRGADSEDMNGGLLEGQLGDRVGHPSIQRVLNYHVDDFAFIPGKGNYGERILLTPSYRVIRTDGTTEHLHWHSEADKKFVSNHKKAQFMTDLTDQNGWLTDYQEWTYYETKSQHVPSPAPPPGELPNKLPQTLGVFACARPAVIGGETVTVHNHAAVDIELVNATTKDTYKVIWGEQSGWLTPHQEGNLGLNGRHLDWDFDVPFLPASMGQLVTYPGV